MVEEIDHDVDTDVEVQTPSSQWLLWPILQILQSLELRRFICQTQISLRKGNIYEEQEHPTNILHCSLWQLRESFPNPNMACNKHKNACQKLWRIHQNICRFSDNLLSRIISSA